MLAEDFDDGNATGWSPVSGTWAVVPGPQGGDLNYSCTVPGMSLVGLAKWTDYVISAELESLTGEAGIVFHAQDASNFYFLSVNKSTPGWVRIWKYASGTTRSVLDEVQVTVTEPVVLRMARLCDGSFLCYANAVQLPFSDAAYAGGLAGVRVETGNATFDDFKVFGANAFLDQDTGVEKLLVDEQFQHINIGGTPYMWALLGNWEVAQETTHGKYFKGTSSRSDTPAEAWRGEEGWVNYRVLADVRLDTDNAEANLYVRRNYIEGWEWVYHRYFFHGFHCYRCVLSYNGNGQATLDLRKRYLWLVPDDPTPVGWNDVSLRSVTVAGFDRQLWHMLEVEVSDIQPGPGVRIKCYFDGSSIPQISFDDTAPVGYTFYNGRVGLATGKKPGPGGNATASFDNVFVLDLGE
jgi:hypothetical protein